MLWFRVLCDSLYFHNLVDLFHTRRWTCLTWERATAPSRRDCRGSSVRSWSLVYRQTYCSPSGNREHWPTYYRNQVLGHSMMSSNTEDYNIANLICTLHTNMHTWSPSYVSVLLHECSTSFFLSMQLITSRN